MMTNERCLYIYQIKTWKSFVQEKKYFLLTGSFRPLRRKKSLQLSQAITPKLRPNATEPQTTQINELFFVFFGFLDCLSFDDYKIEQIIFKINNFIITNILDRSFSFSPGSKIIVSYNDALLFDRICSIIFSSLVIILSRRGLELDAVVMVK